MGLPPQGQYMGAEAGHLLGEISEDEHDHGRPMLSALAVSAVTGMPGEGFFKLARNLGKLTNSTLEAKGQFWENERNAVYAVWK